MCNALQYGPVVVESYKGSAINWSDIQTKREQIVKKCRQGELPEGCRGCYCLETKDWEDNPKLKLVEIYHWLHCNCSCVYCSNINNTKGIISPQIKKSDFYDLLPILKDIVSNNMLDASAGVSIGGGEPTLLKELPDLLELLYGNSIGYVYLPTSGVLYSDAVEKAIKTNDFFMTISIDAGSPETYKKIKRVDSFDTLLNNIRRYIQATPITAEILTLKYIIIDNINDNIQEIEKWLLVALDLGLKYVNLSVEYSHSIHQKQGKNVPKHYYDLFEYAKKRSEELGLTLREYDSVRQILDRGHY